jgi:hypothetical protein
MKLFFILFFFVSCLRREGDNQSLIEQEVKLSREWMYAKSIDGIKANDQVIDRPVGVDQFIFKITFLDESGIHFKNHCVYYKVPYKKILGLMRVQEIAADKSCPENPSEQSWIEINGMKSLAVSLNSFKLSLNFLFQEDLKVKKVKWEIPLLNFSQGLTHEKYQAPLSKKLYPSITFLRLTEESLENSNNPYLGKLNDRFSKSDAIRCRQINKNCEIQGVDRCDECRYGWYQVVDYNCPQGGSRFCGQNHCGEKNEPACPRGSKSSGSEDLGICQSDLVAVRNADQILICQ